jgi:ribosomal-protein-alanine N-acetyltransferase
VSDDGIETARLRLRPVRQTDAALLPSLITPVISRWTANWIYPFTAAMANERVAATLADNAASTGFNRVLTDKEDGRVIGWFRATLVSETPRTASIGYWLIDAVHSRGYLTEALPVFVQAAIAALKLERLESGAQPENAASIAALTRLGLRFIGQRQHYVPARDREELTNFYAMDCPGDSLPSGS